MTPEQLALILGAGGAGAIIVALINGAVKVVSGSASRERDRNTEALRQRINAVEERDIALHQRGLLIDALALARRRLIEAGIDPGPWPDIDPPH